MLCGITAAEN